MTAQKMITFYFIASGPLLLLCAVWLMAARRRIADRDFTIQQMKLWREDDQKKISSLLAAVPPPADELYPEPPWPGWTLTSTKQRAELTELEAGAAPRPWRRAQASQIFADGEPMRQIFYGSVGATDADAALLIAARNALPDLVADVTGLKGDLLRMEIALAEVVAERDALLVQAAEARARVADEAGLS